MEQPTPNSKNLSAAAQVKAKESLSFNAPVERPTINASALLPKGFAPARPPESGME
jgi:hypothetical protein